MQNILLLFLDVKERIVTLRGRTEDLLSAEKAIDELVRVRFPTVPKSHSNRFNRSHVKVQKNVNFVNGIKYHDIIVMI